MKLDPHMTSQMSEKNGFIAALDQSGGSTPKALGLYGIPETDYGSDEAMFRLVHQMRVRIMTAPSFSDDKVIGAILFERTMDGDVNGKPAPSFLWEDRGIVPFLKVDKGLLPEDRGVQLMKPLPELNEVLARAVGKGIFGTKMRSVIADANKEGIASIVQQQFDLAITILNHGLVPIIEPEVLLGSPTKPEAEAILRAEILRQLDALPDGQSVMIKVSIPSLTNFYAPLIEHTSVLRVVALSGGYSRTDACEELRHNVGMIASFSRALTEDLRVGMSDPEFDASLSSAITQIYTASAIKA